MNKTCVSAYSFKAWGLKYHVWFDIIICDATYKPPWSVSRFVTWVMV